MVQVDHPKIFKIALLVFILKCFKQFEIIAAIQVQHLAFNLYLKHTTSGLQ